MKINLDNPIIQGLSKLFDATVVTVLYLLCCLPIVTAPAATTALYATLMSIVGGRGSGVLRDFWSAFRDNFRQATLAGVLLLLAGLVVAADVYACWGFAHEPSVWLSCLRGLTVFCVFLYLAVSIYLFSGLARFVVTTRQALQNAILWTVGSLPTTLGLLLTQIVILAALYLMWLWGLPLVVAALYLQGVLLERHMTGPKEDGARWTGKDGYYE